MRRNFADYLRRNCSPAFLPITWDEMSVKPYELPANYVQSSTYNETMSHLTMQLSFILQWFYLLGGWGRGGGGLGFTSCASAISATPATQSEGRCHQMPRLPRNLDVDVTKWTSMSPSAPPGDWGCRQVPRLTATMVLPFRFFGGWGGGWGLYGFIWCANLYSNYGSTF